MAIATKPQARARNERQTRRAFWKTPTSQAWWAWLLACAALYGGVYAWYLYALHTQPFPGPFNDPLRLFGILALLLVLLTAAYSLRRRFVRGLPGKAQDWLWMHVWVGITAIGIAFLHENYAHILHDFCQNASCLSEGYGGTSALLALFVLVFSGIFGRLLDRWQTGIIARDAQMNGEGIAQSLAERILHLELTVERLCAGKSAAFKHYCMEALNRGGIDSFAVPSLEANERQDFQQVYEVLIRYTNLGKSLRRQQRARRIMHTWRTVHMAIASLALLVILYHGIMELAVNVFHIA